jgi:2-haloalkanoic acid dehalogenase type II
MIHTVIFDVGGTLVNAPSVFQAFADVLDSSRREELFKYMRPIFMQIYRDENRSEFWTIKEIAAHVVKKAAIQFGLEDISDKVGQVYGDYYLNQAKLFEDTRPTLDRLQKKGIKLIAVSDADSDVLMRELSTFKIDKYFDRIIISSDVGAYKPTDKMVAYIRDRVDRPYHNILFVGDTEVDVLTGRKLNAHSVLIRRNGKFPYSADYQISDLKNIFGIISELENE